ncbi:fructokinase [Paramicrobacterium humi]|uniref:Fructokinase n=1 Tax=Paramicrobacterium humi TaxID=640635 RepID=A0A1H4NBY2_9MICO|nr:carbohydrate kinase [Microbacterium humi]SEB92781.1 fructokinase [Microbacterium humi]
MDAVSELDDLSSPDVLIVGEALVDIVHRADGSVDEKPGGSPANVALTLGRLERHPRLLTSFGRDAPGNALRAWLDTSRVRVHGAPSEFTSTAVAHVGADGSATYSFSIAWDVDADSESDADVLHVGSIAAVLEPGASAVSDFVDRHRGRGLVSYDPNVRPRLMKNEGDVRARMLGLIERADVVKASDEDLEWLHPGEPIADVARQWVRSGPLLVVVTRGGRGALAVTNELEIDVPGVPVEVVDTVGAGDTFMGALIDGLLTEGVFGSNARSALQTLEKRRLSTLLSRAAKAAAVTVSRPGADPPTLAELDATD